jgi:hypothetical protein
MDTVPGSTLPMYFDKVISLAAVLSLNDLVMVLPVRPSTYGNST